MELTRISLVRHGAIERTLAAGQRHDPDLTPAGRDEVAALATSDRLTGPPTVVLRSPARRSAATATLLGWADARIDPAWAERDLGTWEGRPWAELLDTAPAAARTDAAAFAAFTPPGGEPVAALWDRIRAALTALPAVDHVAVVTHAGPIVATVATALELSPAVALRLRVGTATVTRLTRFADGTLTVEAVGA